MTLYRLTPRQRWHAPLLALALVAWFFSLYWALVWFRAGATGAGIGAAFAYFGWGGWIVLSLINSRRMFKLGWHAGFVDGVTLGERTGPGEPPLPVLRQMANGDPAPEPWDPHATQVHFEPGERP